MRRDEAELALADLCDAAGTDEGHNGWLIKTRYGLLYYPDGAPHESGLHLAIEAADHSYGFNYAWVWTKELEGHDFTEADVLQAAILSEDRVRFEAVTRTEIQM